MSAQNYYLLGQVIAVFDPNLQQLTPGCVNNLLSMPARAHVVLRHVWAEMLADRQCRDLLGRIDWLNFRASVEASGSFWLGYYQHRDKTG